VIDIDVMEIDIIDGDGDGDGDGGRGRDRWWNCDTMHAKQAIKASKEVSKLVSIHTRASDENTPTTTFPSAW